MPHNVVYTINEVAEMTGLSTKTLRNYISIGLLEGFKDNGVWKFTMEAVSKTMSDPFVTASIDIKNNIVVKDFLTDEAKKEDSTCIIIDKKADATLSENVCTFICERGNADYHNVQIKFSFRGEHARIILAGPTREVMSLSLEYYEKYEK